MINSFSGSSFSLLDILFFSASLFSSPLSSFICYLSSLITSAFATTLFVLVSFMLCSYSYYLVLGLMVFHPSVSFYKFELIYFEVVFAYKVQFCCDYVLNLKLFLKLIRFTSLPPLIFSLYYFFLYQLAGIT